MMLATDMRSSKVTTAAGTYVYGQQTQDATRRKAGHPHSGIVRRPIDEWPIVIHNVYPAYISWETCLANRAQLSANQNRYREDQPGVPKKGQALLQGILRCGRCSALMRLRYSGSKGEFPAYECNYAYSEYGASRCQEVRDLGLDAEVEGLLLSALEPDQIVLAMAALEELEQEYAAARLCQTSQALQEGGIMKSSLIPSWLQPAWTAWRITRYCTPGPV